MKRAILELTDHLLMEVLKNGFNKGRAIISIVKNALPDDVEIVRIGVKGNEGNMYGYNETGVLRLLLQSEEFEDVPLGSMYPVLPNIVMKTEYVGKAVKWEDQRPYEDGDYWVWHTDNNTSKPRIEYWDGVSFASKFEPIYWAHINYPTLKKE